MVKGRLPRLPCEERAWKREGTNRLAERPEIHIHPSCVNVLKEVQQWKWKKDPTSGLYIDEPVEFMDDAMAALRYSVERLRRGSSIEVLK